MIAGVVVVRDWRKIHLRSTGWLLAPTFLGIPLGIALLTSAHQNFVKGILVVILVVFSVYSLTGTTPPELHRDSRGWLLGCGFLAGVLGGAYGMNGPPLVIGERSSDDGILVDRAVGSCRDALLSDFSSGRDSGDISWQNCESPAERRRVSQVCSRRFSLCRAGIADAGYIETHGSGLRL